VIGMGLGLYVGWTGLYLLITGPYGLSQLQAYAHMLTTATSSYPWQGQEAMFETFQQSIYQTWLRYFDFQPWIGLATTLCKLALIAVSLNALRLVWRNKTS